MTHGRLSMLALALASSFGLALAGAAPGAAAESVEMAAAEDPPNVVVVLLDDARVDDLTTMPAVRSLIGDAGATFTRATSPFPLCCPARATLLTGQYAHNHGVLGNAAPKGGFTAFDDSQTLATWLDPTYATGWFGKYFNEYGNDGSSAYVPPGWDTWAAPLRGWAKYRSPSFNVDGTSTTYPGRYQTDVLGDLATQFVTEHAGGEQPFFLTTSILAPHAGSPTEADDPANFPTPNVADEYVDAFAGRPLPKSPAFNEADVRDKPVRGAPLSDSEVAGLTEVNQQRRESLLSAEDVVERLLTVLEQTGELDNTYVLLTSDNGYVLGEHRLRGGKVFPYEVATNVPLLVRGPGIAPGTAVDQQVGLHDLAPTVLGMTDQGAPAGAPAFDGVDLLDVIADPYAHAQRPMVLEAGPDGADQVSYRFHGIRTTRWKYVERGSGKHELYDLDADPYELENRFGAPRYQEVQAQLASHLRDYEYCAGTQCTQPLDDSGLEPQDPPASQVHYTFTGEDSVAFDWVGGSTTIEYGPTSEYGSSATASEPTPVPTSSAGPFREVELAGLEPDTEYRYSIGGGPDRTFHTAPAGSYRVAALGDIGDSTTYPWITQTMDQIAAGDPSFVLGLGDLTYGNYNCAAAVDQHFNDVQAWSLEAAYLPVWGNHEYAGQTSSSQPCGIQDTFANYKGRFALPNAQGLAGNGPQTSAAPGCALVDGTNPCQNEDWYWFDAPPVRWVVGPEPFAGAVGEWRSAASQLMAEADADPDIEFVVTASHRPAYSSGGRTSPGHRAAMDALGDRFPEYVLNLNGHVHTNEVFAPQHGVTHVTAGAGGEGLDRLPTPVAGSAFQLRHGGFVVLDVTPDAIRLDVVCGPEMPATFTPDSCVQGETVASFRVTDRPPVADWSAGCTALDCTFDATASQDRGGSVVGYEWSFGDGTTGTGPTPSHTYATPGVHAVRLTVTDDQGLTDTDRQWVTVDDGGTVAFRAGTSVSALARRHPVTVPAEVRSGDGLVAYVTTNNPARSLTVPKGWQLAEVVATPQLETFVLQRRAVATTAGSTVGFTLDATVEATTTLAAYSGTAASGPVGAVVSTTATKPSAAHQTPTMPLATDASMLVSYWSDRAAGTTGWALPADVTGRAQSAGTGTGHTSAAVGDSAGPVPAGTAGGLVATTGSRTAHASTVSVLLAPRPG